MKKKTTLVKSLLQGILFLIVALSASAQTDMDAIMMNRNQFCNGFLYNNSSWDHYWEGTLKRDNANLGTVKTSSLMYMANYGITDNLNIMAGAPYVWTKATAGTLHGMNGVQDLSVFVKWRFLRKNMGKHKLSFYGLAGVSTPLSDYVADFLPLSIGLHSSNLMVRAMADYQYKRFTVTGWATYVMRSNVEIDRTSYYDTEMRLTNVVNMPNAAQYQLRMGYRGKYLLAEAHITNWTTLGGFDITRNNMPFPSNKMNATQVGASFKYTLKAHTNLSFLAGGQYTVAGRNMGQAMAYNAGAFYAFYFGKTKTNKK